MEFARKYKEVLVDLYVNKKMSTYEIADKLNTYANKVRLALKFLGIAMRDYKDAQRTALETGRAEHPTRGKTLTEDHKRSVGRARAKAWQEMTDEERERVSQISKNQWLEMSEADKAELFRLAAQAVRETSKEGSQTEKFVCEGLKSDGWTVQFHVKDLVPNSNLEIDMFLPEIKTAIEIDGPAHFLPIWGEQKLQKHQAADAAKEGLLANAGYVLIRVKQIDKSTSVTKMENILNAIRRIVAEVSEKFPPKNQRIIEIEVKNGQVK